MTRNRAPLSARPALKWMDWYQDRNGGEQITFANDARELSAVIREVRLAGRTLMTCSQPVSCPTDRCYATPQRMPATPPSSERTLPAPWRPLHQVSLLRNNGSPVAKPPETAGNLPVRTPPHVRELG